MTLKKIRIKIFFKVLLTLIISSLGIWLSWIIIKFVLADVVTDLKWPGFAFFIRSGSLITIAISTLATVVINASAKKKLNYYNITGSILLLISIILYIRSIGLMGRSSNPLPDIVLIGCTFVLLYFSLLNRNKINSSHTWFESQEQKVEKFDVFLSFAIAGNKNSSQRSEVEERITAIHKTLETCGYLRVFNASKYFDQFKYKITPSDAAREDFLAIQNSKSFLFYYPYSVPTSAIMELGYALRDNKKILIITKDKNVLPFLAREISQGNPNIEIIEYGDDFQVCIDSICRSHKRYLESADTD